MSKVYLLSLGCPKNQVDSEKLLKKMAEKNICYTSDPDSADLIMVNTCGFIEAAKKESINEILRIAGFKAKDGSKKLVVYGCLAKRYGDELRSEIPEIDALWGVGEDEKIIEYCSTVLSKKKGHDTPELFSDKPYAYLKIAEGCDRTCAYCAIPAIRGSYRSSGPDRILSEASALVRSGIKELIVIAQDITSYGKDLKGYDLSRLIKELTAIEGDFWIRLLYLYPTSIDDRLIETIGSLDKVCNYIDMPLQHSEKKILGLMQRGGNRTYFERLIKRTREIIPDVALRSTLITGFPQESDTDFENMLAFIKKIRFDRLGVFTYSKEEGTPAVSLKGHLPARTKQARFNRLMEAQAGISLSKNKALVGKNLRVLVEETENGIAIGRLYSQAPEIDGVVIIKDDRIAAGGFTDVCITKAFDYDLEGKVIR
ncbi:MAG: 30S ribosomal protein S12 methylthiotransferase RimO [Nitrospirae bacterium]|nr:30S ribosomal protein S12 methylthiotransferase RimO [Nitrospirota bacterium]